MARAAAGVQGIEQVAMGAQSATQAMAHSEAVGEVAQEVAATGASLARSGGGTRENNRAARRPPVQREADTNRTQAENERAFSAEGKWQGQRGKQIRVEIFELGRKFKIEPKTPKKIETLKFSGCFSVCLGNTNCALY